MFNCWFGFCLDTLNVGSIFFRLALAVLLGGVIGLERGFKSRAAGMRTYMLVSLGAALVMITNEYMFYMFPGVGDPARMGAQVVSGIGFLGAGTIIVTRDKQIKGLTTAAGLWASASMGLAVGVGFYPGALIGALFILFVTTGMHRLDIKISKSRAIELYVELKEGSSIPDLLKELRERGIKVTHLEIVKAKYDTQDRTSMMLSLLLPTRKMHFEFVAEVSTWGCVGFVEEV